MASTKVENTEPAGATSKADIKGKIVALAWQLKKQGYAETTIAQCIRQLKRLPENAKLSNPESVKELLANHDDWKPS